MQSSESRTPLEGPAECTEPSPWEGSVCESVPKTTCVAHGLREETKPPKPTTLREATTQAIDAVLLASRHRHGATLTVDE